MKIVLTALGALAITMASLGQPTPVELPPGGFIPPDCLDEESGVCVYDCPNGSHPSNWHQCAHCALPPTGTEADCQACCVSFQPQAGPTRMACCLLCDTAAPDC
jgi:hypothetical protein